MSDIKTFYGTEYTVNTLLESGVHYGHRKNFWNPKMSPYIYGIKDKVHIIDLRETVVYLERALNILKQIASQNGKILFVGTKKQARDAIASAASKCGQYYVNHRWLGGMITNWKTVSDSIKTLNKYEDSLKEENTMLVKKEILSLSRKRDKLNAVLGGIKTMGGVPDALFVIGVKDNMGAVKEAVKMKIPVIGIVDTNCKFDDVDYMIPGNDDSRKAIELYCELAAKAIELGQSEVLSKSKSTINPLQKEGAAKTSTYIKGTNFKKNNASKSNGAKSSKIEVKKANEEVANNHQEKNHTEVVSKDIKENNNIQDASSNE